MYPPLLFSHTRIHTHAYVHNKTHTCPGDEILSALYDLPHHYVPPSVESVSLGLVSTDGIEMSKSVRNFYAANKLEHVGEQITALGAKSTEDLLIIDDEDLSEAGLRRLDVKRFKAGVQNMRDAAANDAAATSAAPDVEQKNDQDTVIIDNDTSGSFLGEELY